MTMTYSDNDDDQKDKYKYKPFIYNKKLVDLHSNKQIVSMFMATLLILSIYSVSLSLSFDNSNAFGAGIRPPEPLIPQGLINFDKKPSTNVFNMPPGYKIEPVLWNLTLPVQLHLMIMVVCILQKQAILMVVFIQHLEYLKWILWEMFQL